VIRKRGRGVEGECIVRVEGGGQGRRKVGVGKGEVGRLGGGGSRGCWSVCLQTGAW